MKLYRTLQSTSVDFHQPKNIIENRSASTKHQTEIQPSNNTPQTNEFVSRKVQSYFPCSGFMSAYPEPRIHPDRGKRINPKQPLEMEQILSLKAPDKQQNTLFSFEPKPLRHPRFAKLSQVIPFETNDNKTQTISEQNYQNRGKRNFPTYSNRPSTSTVQQFGFVKTFYVNPIETERVRSETKKKYMPENINQWYREKNIISWRTSNYPQKRDGQRISPERKRETMEDVFTGPLIVEPDTSFVVKDFRVTRESKRKPIHHNVNLRVRESNIISWQNVTMGIDNQGANQTLNSFHLQTINPRQTEVGEALPQIEIL